MAVLGCAILDPPQAPRHVPSAGRPLSAERPFTVRSASDPRSANLASGRKALWLRGKHAMDRRTLSSYQVTGAQSARRAQARNMIMSNVFPDHSRDRGGEPVTARAAAVAPLTDRPRPPTTSSTGQKTFSHLAATSYGSDGGARYVGGTQLTSVDPGRPERSNFFLRSY
jgi:hypothetical protein